MARIFRRSISVFSLALCTAGLVACDKGGTETTPPSEAAEAPASDEVTLRYPAEPFNVRARGTVTMEAAGMQSGTANITGVASYVVKPDADGFLKVSATMDSVDTLDLSGGMREQLLGGFETEEIKQSLAGQSKVWIVTTAGEKDDERTKALPENVEKAAKAEADRAARQAEAEQTEGAPKGPTIEEVSTGLADVFLDLAAPPEMPELALKLDAETKAPLEEKNTPMLGMEIPMEYERSYKLTSGEGGAGVASGNVATRVVASGATELSQGGQSMLIAVDQDIEGTIAFDDSGNVPAAMMMDILLRIEFGENVAEQNISLDLSYERF